MSLNIDCDGSIYAIFNPKLEKLRGSADVVAEFSRELSELPDHIKRSSPEVLVLIENLKQVLETLRREEAKMENQEDTKHRLVVKNDKPIETTSAPKKPTKQTPEKPTVAEAEINKPQKGEPGPEGPRGRPGKDGHKGDAGPAGPQGPKGEKGDRGERGEKGDPGPIGIHGYDGTNGKDGAQGEKGDKGEPGPDGSKGDRGEPGPDGSKGDKGEPGPYGYQGDAGPAGPQGPKGEKGDRGERGEKGDLYKVVWWHVAIVAGVVLVIACLSGGIVGGYVASSQIEDAKKEIKELLKQQAAIPTPIAQPAPSSSQTTTPSKLEANVVTSDRITAIVSAPNATDHGIIRCFWSDDWERSRVDCAGKSVPEGEVQDGQYTGTKCFDVTTCKLK